MSRNDDYIKIVSITRFDSCNVVMFQYKSNSYKPFPSESYITSIVNKNVETIDQLYKLVNDKWPITRRDILKDKTIYGKLRYNEKHLELCSESRARKRFAELIKIVSEGKVKIEIKP